MPAHKSPGSHEPARSKSAATTAGPSDSPTGHGPAAGSPAHDSPTSDSAGFAAQLVDWVVERLGLLLLSRERIQEALDDAATRGRITRADANELVAELVKRGRQQTDDLRKDIEQLLGRGREQLESASRRARRAGAGTGAGAAFPIVGYDELTAARVADRLKNLTPAELRRVRTYERRHGNRKSVLAAIERSLAAT